MLHSKLMFGWNCISKFCGHVSEFYFYDDKGPEVQFASESSEDEWVHGSVQCVYCQTSYRNFILFEMNCQLTMTLFSQNLGLPTELPTMMARYLVSLTDMYTVKPV